METVDWYFAAALVMAIGATIFGTVRATVEHKLKWMIGGLVLFLVVAIAWVVHAEYRWELYKEAHDCTQTGETKIVTIPICHQVGKVTVCTPTPVTKYQWACDGDGLIWH